MAIATPGQQVLSPPREINQLLSYLLLVAMDPGDSRVAWNGKTVHIKSSAETTIAISEIQVRACAGGRVEACEGNLHPHPWRRG